MQRSHGLEPMHRACHDWSMSLEPKASAAAKSDIDHRLLIPFLAHAILVQALILVIRITTSYRTIELDLPVVWLGIIATGFALIPARGNLSDPCHTARAADDVCGSHCARLCHGHCFDAHHF